MPLISSQVIDELPLPFYLTGLTDQREVSFIQDGKLALLLANRLRLGSPHICLKDAKFGNHIQTPLNLSEIPLIPSTRFNEVSLSLSSLNPYRS